ncbi:MAG: tetratricopeptide repeat protein [Deltaproteobacteria bacterium]|nr:tetratricopeptide repeat protein [Deltaproteobacteria bacterium]
MKKKMVLVICALGTLAIGAGQLSCNRDKVASIEMINQCVDFHRRKMFPQAVRDCSKAITLDPESADAHHSLGMIYIETKEYEQAARHLQKAVAFREDNALYHYQLGEVYEWMNQPEQAAKEYERAVALDPALYKAHYRLGLVSREAEPEKAMQKFTDAINRNPRFADAYRDLGLIYSEWGLYSQAEQVFREGIKALAGQEDAVAIMHHLLGTVLSDKKEYAQAIQEFKTALELKPGMDDAMFSLGWTYSFTNVENAKIWLSKFLQSTTGKTRPDYVTAAQTKLYELQFGLNRK